MYQQHCQNLTEIEGAIDLVELDLRRHISTEKEKFEYRYTKLLSYLITCWAEVRILKVAYEENAFTPSEINSIITATTLENRWKAAVDISICKAYNKNINLEIAPQLDFTPRTRYNEINSLIANDLVPSLEIRNRIAHGQWKIAFTNDLKNISTELTGKLRTENIVSLQLKKKLFIGLALIINDLAVSPATFNRDFDGHYRMIEENKRNLHNRTYAVYKASMIAKYQRGLVKRNS